MSLSIYESVVQPILRRLSRSSNDSDHPRVSAYNQTGAVSHQHDPDAIHSPGLEEEEVVISQSNAVWDPRTEPRHVAFPGTESGVIVDEPTALAPEEYTRGIARDLGSVQRTVPNDIASRQSGHRNSETSNNPSHGVPHSLRSPASSVSSSLQNVFFDRGDDAASTAFSHDEQERHGDRHPARSADATFPADDGMALLRKRILEIQRGMSTQEEKSRSMHALMTERYNQCQPSLHSARPRSNSPASFSSFDRPNTPRSSQSYNHTMFATSPPTSLSSVAVAADPVNLSAKDREPTYYCKPRSSSTFQDNSVEVPESDNDPGEAGEEAKPLGCAHYKRNIKLQCSACGGWYTCRFCHDEVEDHSLNRRETKYMLCMFCGCAQKASEVCAECGEGAASYYCDVCKLWDDDTSRNIYHCHDCGICRVGQGLGKDFFHCKTCCVCLSIKMADSHRCIERSTDCDCPICGQYMFTSPQTVVFMQCGHSIHLECYREHMRSSYKCPICSRSIVNMESQFGNLQRQIDMQPMPPQFRDTKAFVYCNDCSAKSTVKYHWLGTRCEVCQSFNTAQLRIMTEPGSEPMPIEDTDNSRGLETVPESAAPSRPPSRGRNLRIGGFFRRTGISASVLQGSRSDDPHITRRAIRSASPGMPIRDRPILTSSSSSLDSMDVDADDLEEYNILGMHSPSDREMTGSLHASSEGGDDEEDEEDDDDDDDDDDESMSDESDSQEGENPDPMEIQGHW